MPHHRQNVVQRVKESTFKDTGDSASIPGLGRPPGGGYGNAFQYSCLKNPLDRGVWWAMVQRVTKSWIKLSNGA